MHLDGIERIGAGGRPVIGLVVSSASPPIRVGIDGQSLAAGTPQGRYVSAF